MAIDPERKRQIGGVLSTLKSLFVGTDEEQRKVAGDLAKDAQHTVRRARAREGAINAFGEGEAATANDRPLSRVAADKQLCTQCIGKLAELGIGPLPAPRVGTFICEMCDEAVRQ